MPWINNIVIKYKSRSRIWTKLSNKINSWRWGTLFQFLRRWFVITKFITVILLDLFSDIVTKPAAISNPHPSCPRYIWDQNKYTRNLNFTFLWELNRVKNLFRTFYRCKMLALLSINRAHFHTILSILYN